MIYDIKKQTINAVLVSTHKVESFHIGADKVVKIGFFENGFRRYVDVTYEAGHVERYYNVISISFKPESV